MRRRRALIGCLALLALGCGRGDSATRAAADGAVLDGAPTDARRTDARPIDAAGARDTPAPAASDPAAPTRKALAPPPIKRRRVDRKGPRVRPLPKGAVGGPDFSRVFEAVAPAVLGVVAGRLVDGRFQADRTGTGFVWDSDGRIVTNAHLIGDAPRIRVRTRDGRVTRARLVGLDALTDLAVIDPGPLNLPPVALAPADSLRPGAWVAAIGNPLGMAHSITVGVISAVGRRTLPPGAPKLAEFIQSDVTVDIGSSGGPLVDTRGRVVGLNTAVVGGKLTFSIRIDMVRTVAERLIADGAFARGFAGLYTGRLTARLAREAGLKKRRGVLVRGVVDGGPAHAAGLTPGDLLLSFGEHDLDDPEALPWLVAATRPGSVIPLRIVRGTTRMTLELTVGEATQ